MGPKKAAKKPEDKWNTFGLRVVDHNVDLEWGFNSAIHDKRWASDESPVYASSQHMELKCVILWPEEQEGELYRITLYEPSQDWFFGPPTDFTVKLEEFAVEDKKGNRKYRKYKDHEIGLYDPPFEIGMIEKGSGEYSAWAKVEGEILSQMINLVLSSSAVYVHIREIIRPKPAGRPGKNRWVTGISISLGDEDERKLADKLER